MKPSELAELAKQYLEPSIDGGNLVIKFKCTNILPVMDLNESFDPEEAYRDVDTAYIDAKEDGETLEQWLKCRLSYVQPIVSIPIAQFLVDYEKEVLSALSSVFENADFQSASLEDKRNAEYLQDVLETVREAQASVTHKNYEAANHLQKFLHTLLLFNDVHTKADYDKTLSAHRQAKKWLEK